SGGRRAHAAVAVSGWRACVNRYRGGRHTSLPDRGTATVQRVFPDGRTVERWARDAAWRGVGPPVPPVRSRTGGTLVVRSDRGLLDLQQELGVALGLLQLVQDQRQRLLGVQGVQHPAELPDDVELLGGQQDLLLAGAGRLD